MADLKSIKELALHAVNHTAPANFSVEDVNEALRGELKQMAGSVNDFMRNRYDIYDIIITAADSYVPKKVIETLGQFAEIKQVPQGQTAMFKRGIGKLRAKKFLTQVGFSGVYETFRLDKESFPVIANAVGGAATIDFERLLDGDEVLSDVMDVITEGLADAVYYQVQKALVAAAANNGAAFSSNNFVTANTFTAANMLKIVNTVRAYGNATIFATNEFISAMGPDAIVPAIAGAAQGIYPVDDIDSIHRLGRIQIFRGTPIVELPQSFIDESNDKTWINPQYAYVLPTGQEKVVKVVLEGNTQIHDFVNRDNSLEIHAYRKLGCAILSYNNWGIYKNTGIADNSANPYGY